jgi:predicted enzyme related to lactoylglutathione lyase
MQERIIVMKRITLLVYPVTDLEKAKALFGQFLDVAPYVESPYYVGYRVGDLEVGLDPNAEAGPIAYTDVEDIEASLKEISDAGAEIIQGAADVGNGLLIARVKDTNGNVIGFRQQP